MFREIRETQIKKRHWCPKNGCGKRVSFDFRTKIFTCSVCNSVFTKEELEEWKRNK